MPPIYQVDYFIISPKDSLAQIPEWPFKIRTSKSLDKAKTHITHPMSLSFLFTCLSHCRIFWCSVGPLLFSSTSLSRLYFSAHFSEILCLGPTTILIIIPSDIVSFIMASTIIEGYQVYIFKLKLKFDIDISTRMSYRHSPNHQA